MKRMNFPGRRDKRRAEAAERQVKYEALAESEKRARNPQRYGTSR